MSSLKVKTVETNQLFFNQYQYSVRFDLPELSIIRGLHLNSIDQLVKERNDWRRQNKRLYGHIAHTDQITDEMKENLRDMCKLLSQHRDHIKFVISFDRGYVYTNDLDLTRRIAGKQSVARVQVREAKPVCAPGSLARVDPKWSHRTYFKSRSISLEQRKSLVEYLQSRENVRLSPGLSAWVKDRANNWWINWTHAHFFIDHNNDGEVLFLNMVSPNITGRTLQIVAK